MKAEILIVLIVIIMSSHGTQEITDPVEEMLKKTGCIELHYKVQVHTFITVEILKLVGFFLRNV